MAGRLTDLGAGFARRTAVLVMADIKETCVRVLSGSDENYWWYIVTKVLDRVDDVWILGLMSRIGRIELVRLMTRLVSCLDKGFSLGGRERMVCRVALVPVVWRCIRLLVGLRELLVTFRRTGMQSVDIDSSTRRWMCLCVRSRVPVMVSLVPVSWLWVVVVARPISIWCRVIILTTTFRISRRTD